MKTKMNRFYAAVAEQCARTRNAMTFTDDLVGLDANDAPEDCAYAIYRNRIQPLVDDVSMFA